MTQLRPQNLNKEDIEENTSFQFIIYWHSHKNVSYLRRDRAAFALQAHPDGLQSFDLLVQPTVDVAQVEQRVARDLAQQIAGEVADVVLAEVPLPQHSAGNDRLRVLVAALAEVAAQVFTVAQALDVIWTRGQEAFYHSEGYVRSQNLTETGN